MSGLTDLKRSLRRDCSVKSNETLIVSGDNFSEENIKRKTVLLSGPFVNQGVVLITGEPPVSVLVVSLVDGLDLWREERDELRLRLASNYLSNTNLLPGNPPTGLAELLLSQITVAVSTNIF